MDPMLDGESVTSSPPTASHPQPARKTRVALACKRCKKRKQRVSLLPPGANQKEKRSDPRKREQMADSSL